MADDVTRGMFGALVARAGGVDAVAAVLEARYGTGSKGTVSKMCAGQIGVTVAAMVAVEDFVGAYPMTSRLARRMEPEPRCNVRLADLAAQSVATAGEAHAALIRAVADQSLSSQEAAQIVAMMSDLREKIDRIIRVAKVEVDHG